MASSFLPASISNRVIRHFTSRRRGCAAVLALLGLGVATGMGGVPSAAQEAVGEAAVVRNSVSGLVTGQQPRRLAVADAVFGAEQISAGADSHGEIRLNDDSLVIVGENSSVSLDNFVVAEGGFADATVNVTKGAFRFITGNSPKQAFRIVTPLSTIGVRGTIFDIYVDEQSGNTKVVLFSGVVRVCTLGSACLIANRSCDIIEVRSSSDIEKVPFLRSAARSRADEAAEFRLAERQQRFQERWRAPTTACAARAAQEALGGGARGGGGPDNPARDVPEKER